MVRRPKTALGRRTKALGHRMASPYHSTLIERRYTSHSGKVRSLEPTLNFKLRHHSQKGSIIISAKKISWAEVFGVFLTAGWQTGAAAGPALTMTEIG